jgi:hypothetical protein
MFHKISIRLFYKELYNGDVRKLHIKIKDNNQNKTKFKIYKFFDEMEAIFSAKSINISINQLLYNLYDSNE